MDTDWLGEQLPFLYPLYSTIIKQIMKNRTILHIDFNSFFASVEQVLNPSLKKVPMSVTGDPKLRHGIILASNTLAKQKGVKTAETISMAKAKCPDLVCVPPHYDLYTEYSLKGHKIYLSYTDLVEPFGIDECWLDVTNSLKLFGSGMEIARKIRQQVLSELKITVSIGVSYNKIFAKLGSDYKKPDAITEITKHNFKDIVHPLPVRALLMVGSKTEIVLSRLGLKTIGDLAICDTEILYKHLGANGVKLWYYANGLDQSSITAYDKRPIEKSISKGMTFAKDLITLKEIKTNIFRLSEEVGFSLRVKKLVPTVIQIGIKDHNLNVINRQKILAKPSNLTQDIRQTAVDIILSNWEIGKPIRALTVHATNFNDPRSKQLSLFDNLDSNKDDEKLQQTIDELNKKFGKGMVTTAREKE